MKKINNEEKAREYLDKFLENNGIDCEDSVYEGIINYIEHLIERDYFGEKSSNINLVEFFKKRYTVNTRLKILNDAIFKNSKSLYWELNNVIEDEILSSSGRKIINKQQINLEKAD